MELYLALAVSIIVNGLLLWYIVRLLRKFVFISEDFFDESFGSLNQPLVQVDGTLQLLVPTGGMRTFSQTLTFVEAQTALSLAAKAATTKWT